MRFPEELKCFTGLMQPIAFPLNETPTGSTLRASAPLNGRETRGPDFIIGGAMKCATTTLHHILAQHPQIYIPKGEVKFFDIDDFNVHPHNFGPCDGQWNYRSYDRDRDTLLPWYVSHFAAAPTAAVIGEDSPSYLASDKAPSRIRHLLPDVRLIFLLRDPVERAYSHYWHWVATGRAVESFEEAIVHSSSPIVSRGLYKLQLRRYLEAFSPSQLKVIVFEDFIKNPHATVTLIEQFLGVEPLLRAEQCVSHSNAGRTPRYPRLQLWLNRWERSAAIRRQSSRFPGIWRRANTRIGSTSRRIVRRFMYGESTTMRPVMRPTTYKFLCEMYAAENDGLSELVGLDLSRYWRSLRVV